MYYFGVNISKQRKFSGQILSFTVFFIDMNRNHKKSFIYLIFMSLDQLIFCSKNA